MAENKELIQKDLPLFYLGLLTQMQDKMLDILIRYRDILYCYSLVDKQNSTQLEHCKSLIYSFALENTRQYEQIEMLKQKRINELKGVIWN